MRARKNWPPNLEGETKGERIYYRYRDPVTRLTTGLGTDFKKAAEAVRVVNAHKAINVGVTDLVERIGSTSRSLHDHANKFLTEILRKRRFRKSGQSLSSKTLAQYELQLDTFIDAIGGKVDVASISRRQIAEFLDSKPPAASNRFRSLLHQLMQYAVAQGLIESNPVVATMKRTEVVERQRLTATDYTAIYEIAHPWFQAAMNLARRSLQRREDLVRLKFDQFDGVTLSLQQSKTASRGAGALRIHVGPQLGAAIQQCRDDLVSPYLIHARHTFHNPKRAAWRTHWTQCSPDELTHEFARLRDHLKLYASLPANQRPSFHEIRSYAGREMELQGIAKPVIQALYGHRTAEMTELYLDRHGQRWLEVKSA